MSILNRPGWANRTIVHEGRLHSDDLKQRISNLFVRTSLGNSPTYAVGKIADILRREKGEDVDINDIADEDIIRIASDQEVTNGKFQPELKGAIADARQETEDQMSGLDGGLPSDQGGEESLEEPETDEFESDLSTEHESEDETELDQEDAEECEAQRPSSEQPIDKIIKKENVKLSPKAVNNLLKENYIKSRQHRFRMEERYRRF